MCKFIVVKNIRASYFFSYVVFSLLSLSHYFLYSKRCHTHYSITVAALFNFAAIGRDVLYIPVSPGLEREWGWEREREGGGRVRERERELTNDRAKSIGEWEFRARQAFPRKSVAWRSLICLRKFCRIRASTRIISAKEREEKPFDSAALWCASFVCVFAPRVIIVMIIFGAVKGAADSVCWMRNESLFVEETGNYMYRSIK